MSSGCELRVAQLFWTRPQIESGISFAVVPLRSCSTSRAGFQRIELVVLRGTERSSMTSGLAQYDRPGETSLYPVIVARFFASGFAALIYQIIWQRAL